MSRDRFLGWLGFIGGLLGLALVVAFTTVDFGYPGTTAYRTYETLNRLMAVPLLFMACGWLGLALALRPGYGRKAARLAREYAREVCVSLLVVPFPCFR